MLVLSIFWIIGAEYANEANESSGLVRINHHAYVLLFNPPQLTHKQLMLLLMQRADHSLYLHCMDMMKHGKHFLFISYFYTAKDFIIPATTCDSVFNS